MTDHKKRAAQNNLHGNIYDHLIEAWTMAEPRPPMGHSFGLSFTSYHPDVQQYLHDFVFRVIQGLLDDGCLQQPDQPDEWEQCRFEDVKDTDLNVRFVFDDGSIIQGKPHMRCLTEIDLWTGYVITQVTMTAAKKGKAKIYRIPATVTHPDPAEHPVIIVRSVAEPRAVVGGVYVWTGYAYVSIDGSMCYLDHTEITDWNPAKVIADE